MFFLKLATQSEHHVSNVMLKKQSFYSIWFRQFFKIKLPIAIRQSLPAYGNEMILMLKGTSLASTVTLLDLTGVAKYIISTTFRPVEVFIVAGSIYLIMTFIIHNFIKFLEKKYSY